MRQLRRHPGLLVAEGEPVEVGLPLDGQPLGKLIENPGDGEPDLAHNGRQPQAIRALHGVQNPVAQEECQRHQSDDDDHSVGVDLGGRDGDLSGEGLPRLIHSANRPSQGKPLAGPARD